MPTNHEKYLAGEPLNDELRALKEGRLQEPDHLWIPERREATATGTEWDLSRGERAALREMRASEGWPVLQKLLKRASMLHTEHATRLSQDDPMAKSEEIAQAWAYLKMLKRAHREIDDLVASELAQQEAKDENDPALQRA